MRNWLFLLAPPALIFYFVAFPGQFDAFVFWMKKHNGVTKTIGAPRSGTYSNDTPSFFPSVQITLQCRVIDSPSIVKRKT